MRYLMAAIPFFLLACQVTPENSTTIPAIVSVPLEIDGNSKDWDQIPKKFETRNFESPWDDTPFGSTHFQAVADNNWLYFCFEAEDTTLVTKPFTKELDVADGDRVEIFISADTSLAPYYCLELGPTGDILDYKAHFYRKFDDSWNLPQLSVRTSMKSQGYTVEGKIPLGFLKKFSNHHVNQPTLSLYLGLYRAEYRKSPNNEVIEQWLTWNDPQISEPDFHIPSTLKQVKIEIAK